MVEPPKYMNIYMFIICVTPSCETNLGWKTHGALRLNTFPSTQILAGQADPAQVEENITRWGLEKKIGGHWIMPILTLMLTAGTLLQVVERSN